MSKGLDSTKQKQRRNKDVSEGDMARDNSLGSSTDNEPVTTIEYKITKAQVRAVLKLIEQGYSKRAACKEVGIARGSFEMAVARINAADHYARAMTTLAEEQ